jgi:hypothetical protein
MGHDFEQFWYHNKLGDRHACQKNCSQLHGFEDETHVSCCCHVQKESTSMLLRLARTCYALKTRTFSFVDFKPVAAIELTIN